MNRREILLGVVATAVAAAVPAVEATATWVELHDGSPLDYVLGDGDFVVEMWLRRVDPARHSLQPAGKPADYVDEFSLKAGSEQALEMLETHGLTLAEAYDVMDVTVNKYKGRVPVDGAWHHVYAFGGRVYVDGVEDPKFDAASGGPFDGTGDYVVVP